MLVVVASLHGQVARPYTAPQGMAAAAARVLAAALRQELRLGRVRGVAVTTIEATGGVKISHGKREIAAVALASVTTGIVPVVTV